VAVSTVCVAVAGFGLDYIVTRETATQGFDGAIRTAVNSNYIKLVLGAVGLGCAVLLVGVSGYPLPVIVSTGLLGAAALVNLITRTAQALFRGAERMAPVARSMLMERAFVAVAGGTIVLAGGTFIPLSTVFLLGALIALGYLSILLRRRGLAFLARGSFREAWSAALASVPLGIAAVSAMLLSRLDVTLLAFMKDGVAVALYGVAYRLFESTLFLSWAFGVALYPMFARLASADQPDALRERYVLALKVCAAALFPLALCTALYADAIVGIVFGDTYSEAATPLQLLSPAVAIYGWYMVGNYVQAAQHLQRQIGYIAVLVLTVNLVLNVALIPRFSFSGAAAAMTASQVLLTTLTLLSTRNSLRLRLAPRVVLGPFLACAPFALSRVLLGESVEAFLLGVVGYVIVLAWIESALYSGDTRIALRVMGWVPSSKSSYADGRKWR
jgi:O-antigen/teichoic acid export membrane protein